MVNAAGVYEGERNTFNRFHGQGTYEYGNGKIYSGTWRDGRRHGHGEQTWADGDHYKGTWSENRAHGKGVKTWANGDRYEGDWIGGKPSGTGHFIWANKDEYTGGFLKGKRNGMGVFTSQTTGRYQGEWKSGKRHGKGNAERLDGTKVSGQWKQDSLVGDAVFTFKNGNQYTGPAVNNRAQGEGVCKIAGKLSPCVYKNGKPVVKKAAKKPKPKPKPAPIVKPKPKVKPKPVVKTQPVVKPKLKPKPKPKAVAVKPAAVAKPVAKSVVKSVAKPVAKSVVTSAAPALPVVTAATAAAASAIVAAKPVVKEPKPEVVNKPVPAVEATPVVIPAPAVIEEEDDTPKFVRKGKRRGAVKSKSTAKAVKAAASKPAFITGALRSDGTVFAFNHDWIMHGYYDTAPKVTAKFDAIKFGDLKIWAEGGDYELTMVIDEYDGLGSYPLKYFKGVISKPGVASYQTTSTLPGRVVIKYNDGKMVGGTFEFVAYRNGNQSSNEKRIIRSGEFLVPITKK